MQKGQRADASLRSSVAATTITLPNTSHSIASGIHYSTQSEAAACISPFLSLAMVEPSDPRLEARLDNVGCRPLRLRCLAPIPTPISARSMTPSACSRSTRLLHRQCLDTRQSMRSCSIAPALHLRESTRQRCRTSSSNSWTCSTTPSSGFRAKNKHGLQAEEKAPRRHSRPV